MAERECDAARSCDNCRHDRHCHSCDCINPILWEPQPKCPLPRVGSKDWGWNLDSELIYRSTHSSLYIMTNKFYGRYAVFNANDLVEADLVKGLSKAKRIAELLARLDWKRENRGTR